MQDSINHLLNAHSIAVIGANEKSGYSGRLIKNLLRNKFKGTIYPINPKYEIVFGLDCFPSVNAVKEQIDLAVVIVRSDFVIKVVEECEQKGVESILIISAGFSELDKVNGPQKEQELKKIAERSGMRIVGPNCLGIANAETNMWACSLSTLGVHPIGIGRAGIISHSGATGFGPLLTQAKDRGIGFKYIVTTGNEADLNLSHFIDYMLDDNEIDVVAVLIEGVKDGEQFMNVSKKARKLKKPIVVLKIGESEVGQRAAANHTASMTGNDDIFNAFVRQEGLIRVNDYDEFIDIVKIFQNNKQLKGEKIAVVSHSGGIGGMMGDKLGKFGFKVPVLQEKTQIEIDRYLKGFGSAQNPLDLTGQMRTENIFNIIDAVEKRNEVDGYVFATHGEEKIVRRLIEIDKRLNKPMYIVWTGSVYSDGLEILKDSSIPIFLLPEKAGKNLSEALRWNSKVNHTNMEENDLLASFNLSFDKYSDGILNEVESKEVLEAINISIPKKFVLENNIVPQDLELEFARQNYVMKIVSKTIPHKSDLGGVILNINTQEKFVEAFEQLNALKQENNEIDSILIEEMSEEGLELIVGVNRDSQFGPILMVGIGGINAELFKQVTWRVLPVNRSDIEEMINEIPGLLKLLSGFRNQPEYDMESLIKSIEKISALSNHPEIESIEINPLCVLPKGKGTKALDCIVKLKKTLEVSAN